MHKVLDDFIDYINYQRGYSENTMLNYKNDIIEFIDFLKENGINNFDKVDYQIVKKYLMELYNKKLSRSSVSRKLTSLRSLYKYLHNESLVDINPFSLISSPKKEKRLPKFLYNEDYTINDIKNNKYIIISYLNKGENI